MRSGPQISDTSHPLIRNELIVLLARFNAVWQERQQQFTRYASVPAWSPGLILTPTVREAYERYLPVTEFCRDLARLAGLLLPSQEWIPALLRHPGLNPVHDGSCGNLHSLPDFWHQLPVEWAGRLCFTADNLLPLFCACADLRRFGTGMNRYPEQSQQIRNFIRQCPRPCWRVLDLGCGTGAGTRELATLVTRESQSPVLTLGLTREPLEAWMAVRHARSHVDRPSETKEPQPDFLHLVYLTGDVHHLPCHRNCFDLIVVNGLAGGPYLHRENAVTLFFQELERLLVADGLLAMANHFHDGFKPDLAGLVALARKRGWQAVGELGCLFFTRFSGIL